jgi:dynein heavy chain
LQEVAARFLAEESQIPDELKPKAGIVFAATQQSVLAASKRMQFVLKRFNYVTATNFLSLVKGYRKMLSEKRAELEDAKMKLTNGLRKLDESRQQVEEMSIQLEERKEVVAQKNKECGDLLVVIVSERRVADEQKKQVEADSERIGKEAKETKIISDDAQADLDKALPALEKALREVDKLDKGSISEVKAYSTPPPAVSMTLEAVMVLFGMKPDWATAKKKISETSFLHQVKSFDKENISNSIISKLKKFTSREEFTAEHVTKVSLAAGALCTWVLAMEIYSVVVREVAPKRAKLKAAETSLAQKQGSLKVAQEKLAEVTEKVNQLKKSYDDSVEEKNALRKEAEDLELKLGRAESLVKGLSGEKARWESSITVFQQSLNDVVGDALIGAAFLSYAGPFESSFRHELLEGWIKCVREQEIPISENFNFCAFLAKPTDVRDWNIQGLPTDSFSTENGVITTRSSRWPLMIDPQGQANKWIKNMEGEKLRVVDQKMKDFLRELENAITFGFPVLMQDVEEELDPSLEPVLSKNIVKVGNREVLKLGDKELDYNKDFKFYLTTKLQNPHYTPEVSTKTTIVNFVVKEEGLEAQLLGIVVNMEQPDLETRKGELVVKVAGQKRKLVELEDEILRLLSTAEGSLLDDESLVTTLQDSKKTSEEVGKQLIIAEDTEKKIDVARQGYRPVSLRASILYFVLNDLGKVDPMYQFSLGTYVALFQQSIQKSLKSATQSQPGQSNAGGKPGNAASNAAGDLAERLADINNFHTLAIYNYTCNGLFERHKLLFSFQMCIKIMMADNKVQKDEYGFFLNGVQTLKKDEGASNPCVAWLDNDAWDNVSELNKLSHFQGISSSFEQNGRNWMQWYQSSTPELEALPGEWEAKCNDMQRLILIRSLRPDRVIMASSRFVASNIGSQFIEPPAFNLRDIYEQSTPKIPIIFVLSPGVDPTKGVMGLAQQMGRVMENCALGQGQAPRAENMIDHGLKEGTWVLLANCHLMLSWAGTLEKIIENYANSSAGEIHQDYRLWLTSDPTPKFPISILQRGVKITTEPPRGVKANLIRLYGSISEDQFHRCSQRRKYKRLLFCLCWFHALLIERRKFNNLGWNVPYDFNEADFLISEDVLASYLDDYEDTPWDALKYLVAQANYGGRVTDDWDRRLILVYINQFFKEDVLTISNLPLSSLPEYYIPNEGELESYTDFVKTLPAEDHPAAFGQHSNAQIASQIEGTRDMLSTILSLQPRVVIEGETSNEEKVMGIASSMEELVPEAFKLRDVKEALASRADPDPLKIVAVQEVERYNRLLILLKKSLGDLQKGIQGLVVITPELEQVFDGLLIGQVPIDWNFCYPSLKPLGSWMRDLRLRASQMSEWVGQSMPKVFWLSGFTYPTGFLTALLQTSARKNGISIDTLNWEFLVMSQAASAITQHPKEGAYVKGLFLEGAQWDYEHGCLKEPNPMELYCGMPIIHFKPTDGKKKLSKGLYTCPLYLYPIRTGTRERPSFVIAVELKSGTYSPELWTRRGTALLLSLGS